jgi:hypothetical protein
MNIVNLTDFLNEKFKNVNNDEEAWTEFGQIKIFDYFKAMFDAEFSLQEEYHQQDRNSLIRKIGRYVTLEQKITFLNDELKRQQDFFDESEYFEISEEFSNTIFSELIEKLKKIAPNLKQTSRWKELNNDQKVAFQAIINLPNDFINPHDLSSQKIRSKINQTPALYKTYKSISKQEQGKSTISGILFNIVSEVFYLHFQSKLNQVLQEEYKRLIPEKDYVNAIIDEDTDHPKKKQFTTARQCLALHYLFKSAGVKNVDSTAKATFAQFFLCKELNAIQISNTNIYKRINQPLMENNITNIENLKFVKKIFQSVDLQDIAKEIQNEIEVLG